MGKQVMKFLSGADVEKMRAETIKILEEVGVKVYHDETKKLLENAGAKVDHQTSLVNIPSKLAEECLKKVPRKIVIGGRDANSDVILDLDNEKRLYKRSMTGAEGYIDLQTGEYRKVILSDVKDWGILVDGLENIDIATPPYYSDAGLNLKARDVRALEILLENTSKPILVQPYGGKNVEFMIKLGIAERGSEQQLREKPRFIVMMSPVPPLTYHGNEIEVMLWAGRYGIPLEITSMPICGAAGPVTIAGGVLLTVAEHAAGVVISQLANPGAPVIFAPRTVLLDMHSGAGLEGTVENALISAAETQLAREGFGWLADMYGPTSDSLIADGQSMIERCFNTTLPAYAGADILAGGGNFEHSYTLDPVQLAIDEDILGMTSRVLRGIEVDDDTLGLAAIRRIGAGVERSYLTDEHTMKYFKTEYFRPKVITHAPREIWKSEGGKDLYERAKERVNNILKEHKPVSLSEAVVTELRSIAESAEREITEATTV